MRAVTVQPPARPERASAEPEAQADKTATGVSEFLGRVLDQLSVSAWLPAAMLVGNLAVLIQLRSQGDLNVGQAILGLANRALGILVILLFSLLLGAMITQAFQFEAIRLLEGYWNPGWLRSRYSARRIRRHEKKRERLLRKRNRVAMEALREALQAAVLKKVPNEDLDIMRELLSADLPEEEKTIAIENANFKIYWKAHAPADKLGEFAAINRRYREYPNTARLLPTRLGNTLRSHEDRLKNVTGELEGFVIKVYDELPGFVKQQHDQYRGRLEVYCSLVVTFGILSIVGPVLLLGDKGRFHVASVGCLAIYIAGGVLSYSAAVASARGYGTVLLLIDDFLTEKKSALKADSLPPVAAGGSRIRHHWNSVLRTVRRRD